MSNVCGVCPIKCCIAKFNDRSWRYIIGHHDFYKQWPFLVNRSDDH